MIYLDPLDSLMDYNGYTVATGSQTENSTSVTLKITPLPLRRLWNVTIFAHYCENHPLTPKIELGRSLTFAAIILMMICKD